MSNGNYANFEILPNGNLKISLIPEGKIELTEIQEQYKEQWSDEIMFREIIEHQLCNGWTWVQPEDIGALTEAPILSDDVVYNDDGIVEFIDNVWWYPNYMVESLTEKLQENGYLIFTKVE